ncbi:ATp6v1fnb [Symbiodinium sp. CCMP2592]|nr:ATp6v1fnb [Symbiodinium sp. CCMP2592]
MIMSAARCTQLRGTQPVRTYVLKLFGRVRRLGWTVLTSGRALGLPACFQDVTSPAVKLKQPIAYELQDHLEHAAALVSDFPRSRLESRRTSLKDSPSGTELALPSEAVAARAKAPKAPKAVDPPEGVPVRVVEKFKRHNARYMDGWKECLPHLSKPATSAPPAGRGGVSWIGQNPDPCRAKYLLKQGVVPLPPAVEQKPSQAESEGEPASSRSELSHSQSAPVLQKRGHRQLEMMSCNEHYIEQRLKLEDEQQLRSGPDMKELIYHGVSHDHQGRRAYLQARRRLWPQDRLPAPVTSAAEVGWQSYAGPDKIVGKQLDPVPPPPSTIVLG